MPVTHEDGWSGTSSDLTDVRRAPRFVAWSVLMRAEGIHDKCKGENQSNLTDGRMKVRAPRFVAWFVALVLMLEMSKIDGSNLTGGRMKAPRVVA